MFQTLSRSWSLVKASAEVLKSDRELLVFPLVSGLATLLVAATFALPAIGLGLFESASKDAIGPLHVVLGFAFYVCQYAVIFFFSQGELLPSDAGATSASVPRAVLPPLQLT